MSACDATTAAAVAMHDHGIERPRRHQRVEGVVQRLGVMQQPRRLAEVVEQQCRQRHGEPREADRPAAEVPHVGVQRLAARHHQHHRARGSGSRSARRRGRSGWRGSGLMAASTDGIRSEAAHARAARCRRTRSPSPDRTPRRRAPCRCAAPGRAPAGSPPTRYGTQPSKMLVATVRPSTAPSTEMAGVMMPSPYSSAAPNRPAPIEHRAPPRRRLPVRPDQREQRQDAALAPVVGPQHERDVLEGDHEVHRPEHERHDAHHVLARGRQAVHRVEALLERVERAGADVAVDDTERREGQERQFARRATGAGVVCHGRRRIRPRLTGWRRPPAGRSSPRSASARRTGCRRSIMRPPMTNVGVEGTLIFMPSSKLAWMRPAYFALSMQASYLRHVDAERLRQACAAGSPRPDLNAQSFCAS